MQFTVSAAAFVALICSALAQTANFDAITVPTKDQELVADGTQSYTITWDPTAKYDGQDISILLLQGASEDTLDFYPGADVASSIDSALGTYTWTPDSSLIGYATYGLKLQLDSDTTIFQYSFPFHIKAGSASGISTTVSTATSSSSSGGGSTLTSSVAPISTKTTASPSSAATSATTLSSKEDVISTVTTSASASVTSATSSTLGSGSGSGSGSGAQTTLTTATKPSSTGSATSSSTSVVATAGAGRAGAGGVAVLGGVVMMAAVLAL